MTDLRDAAVAGWVDLSMASPPSGSGCSGGGCGSTGATVTLSRDDELTPIDHYLREQQTMTAVERFSSHHDADLLPTQARYYRDLIPLDRPQAGQQYAFAVDLDSCSGCKACVTACHSLNGLDDGESFRSVGTLFGTTADRGPGPKPGSVSAQRAGAREGLTDSVVLEPWQQTVTTACHHCVDPACLNGCPVDAYEKDPFTGIVKHLDDQCIGCSYCTLMCPYDVPRYNAERGIVRKCDLCSDRLAEGEAPACVQACPTSAISVTIIDVDDLLVALAADATAGLVPAAPSSRHTKPTTRYTSSRPLPPDALPADHFSVPRGHAHVPLTVMLVLTQLSVGAFVLSWLLDGVAAPALADKVRPYQAGVALGVGVLALAASTLHLGRPHLAWRAVIGFGHSWLSREIVAFGAFAGLAALYAGGVLAGMPSSAVRPLGGAAAVVGVLGVISSMMIYAVTGRRWWRLSHTGPKFALSAVITGASAVSLAALAAAATDAAMLRPVLTDIVRPLSLIVAVATIAKLGGEVSIFRHRRDATYTDLRRTAMLLADDLHVVTVWRYFAGLVGGIVMPLVLVAMVGTRPPVAAPVMIALVGIVATAGAELCERWQFFTASTAPRMPGVQQ